MAMTLTSIPAQAGEPDWKEAARERISSHRTGVLTLTVKDRRGAPLEGVEVQARLIRPEFLFGTAISERRTFSAEGPEHDRLRAETKRLFDTVVLENGHKPAQWQDTPRRPMIERAHAWAREQDLRWRGHALVWGVLQYGPVIPEPFHTQLKDGLPIDRAALQHSVDSALVERVLHRRGTVQHWDVVNEPVSERHLFRALGATTVDEEAALIAHWLQLAHRLDPAARLYLNEFGILVTADLGKRDRYLELARKVLHLGAPLHGIGFQAHTWGLDTVNRMEEVLSTCDRFAELGLELCITEFDTFGDWGEEAEGAQAAYTEDLLTAFYSHPAATGVLLWGFHDRFHWKKSAPFFREDWSAKPALEVWERLVLGEWRTEGEGLTDGSGSFRMRGHYGLYEITLKRDGGTRTVRVPHYREGMGSDLLGER